MEAWLTFLCRDEPEIIIELIEQYPEFKPLYEDIYELCLNIEKVMEERSKKHECEMTEVVAKMKKMDEHMMVLNQRIVELEKLLDDK